MQNVNLYQVERQARSGGPDTLLLWLGPLGVLALMLAHGLWLGWQLHDGARAAGLAEQQAQADEAQLAAARAGYREPRLDERLPVQLAEQEADNRQLQRLADYLQRLDGERSIGFAAPLAALAERHPPSGLWLTRIRLVEGGRHLALEGLSQRQETLPLYLQSLGLSPAFRGREFARFQVQREPSDLLRFALSSRAEGGDADE